MDNNETLPAIAADIDAHIDVSDGADTAVIVNEPSPSPPPAKKEKASIPAKRVKSANDSTIPVRILCDHGEFTIGIVADIPANEVASAESAGWADASDEAVAYARAQSAAN